MKKTIGILGGMGPLATADLFRKITLLTKASCDNDHIRVYIDSNAQIPDRTAAILHGGKDPLPQMRAALHSLEACGASCVIMPCNTAHYFLPQLQAETKLPFLSMLEATAKACAKFYPGKTAAVLATKGTLATGLYEKALEKEGVSFIIPDDAEKDTLMHLIYDVVKASKPLAPRRKRGRRFWRGCAERARTTSSSAARSFRLLPIRCRKTDPSSILRRSWRRRQSASADTKLRRSNCKQLQIAVNIGPTPACDWKTQERAGALFCMHSCKKTAGLVKWLQKRNE